MSVRLPPWPIGDDRIIQDRISQDHINDDCSSDDKAHEGDASAAGRAEMPGATASSVAQRVRQALLFTALLVLVTGSAAMLYRRFHHHAPAVDRLGPEADDEQSAVIARRFERLQHAEPVPTGANRAVRNATDLSRQSATATTAGTGPDDVATPSKGRFELAGQPGTDPLADTGMPGQPPLPSGWPSNPRLTPSTAASHLAERASSDAALTQRHQASTGGSPNAPVPAPSIVVAGAEGMNPAPSSDALHAHRLYRLDDLLTVGTIVGCILKNRIDSGIPGPVGCLVDRDVFDETGMRLLIGRGSLVTGETVPMQQGTNRLVIHWTRVRTTGGFAVALDAPLADAQGTLGLAGDVNEHWFSRIGSAFLLSFVRDAIASGKPASNAFVQGQNTSATEDRMSEALLSHRINEPPTLTRDAGARVVMVVMRDIDFSEGP